MTALNSVTENLMRRGRNAVRLGKGAAILRSGPRLTVGARPEIWGELKFNLEGRAEIGDRFIADGRIMPVDIWVGESGSLSIGDGVYLNSASSIAALHEVRIGDHVLLAPFACVLDDHRHEVEPGAPLYEGPTIIGDNVWLGRQAIVMPGVTIGAGSVIGANSVVTKDIPPSVFAAGSPAKVIRPLDLPEGWHRT